MQFEAESLFGIDVSALFGGAMISNRTMGKKLKIAGWWIRRRSQLPFLVIGTLVVLMLYLNNDTSLTRNMEYDRRINNLKAQIRLNYDSASYYRGHRMAIEGGESDLAHLARERYHMQRPSEDVFLIREP